MRCNLLLKCLYIPFITLLLRRGINFFEINPSKNVSYYKKVLILEACFSTRNCVIPN